jgi:hypothetical protein
MCDEKADVTNMMRPCRILCSIVDPTCCARAAADRLLLAAEREHRSRQKVRSDQLKRKQVGDHQTGGLPKPSFREFARSRPPLHRGILAPICTMGSLCLVRNGQLSLYRIGEQFS